jgi:hypothetical protein
LYLVWNLFPMEYFVKKESVVRKIWSKSDIILFIFAGASAEFALNKAVDWLYFTGKLPSDPLGRLFSTVSYARRIIFYPLEEAHEAIDHIRSIHETVEKNRGALIPDWAYRDVLFMLIYYSGKAYELLERKMDPSDQEELYQVFKRVGSRMGLEELPNNYEEWLPVRKSHLEQDLDRSELTIDLFQQYRKHLGSARYKVLIEAQKLVIPARVKNLLGLSDVQWMKPAVPLYQFSKMMKMDPLIKGLLLPSEFKSQIRAMDLSSIEATAS